MKHSVRWHGTLAAALVVGLMVAGADAGLQAYWTFDEGWGPTVTDSVNGNVGTLLDGSYQLNTNPPTFSADVPAAIGSGTSLLFDGSDDLVTVPDSPSLSPTGNITLSAWIKSPDFDGGVSSNNILAKHGNSAYRWRVNTDGQLWALINDGSGLQVIYSGAYAPAGGWHHTAVTVDFTDSPGKVRFYLDGALVATKDTTKTSIADTSGALCIGAYGGAGHESFNGNIDDAAIWDHRLSHGQIAKLAAGISPQNLGVTLLNRSFEEDTFTVWPGQVAQNGPITGWTTNEPTRAGINPVSGSHADPVPFANNGVIPDGDQVAYIKIGGATLSQTAIGFKPGDNYIVTFRENSRAGYPVPNVSVELGGQTVVASHPVPEVEAAGQHTKPYRYIGSSVFTSTSTANLLEFSNDPVVGSPDSTALIDDVGIHKMHLLFSDNFNAFANSNTINPSGNDEPGRQGGLSAPLTYAESAGTPASQTQINHSGSPDSLLLASISSFSTVTASPNHNFNLPGPDGAHFVIEYSVDPTAAVSPGDWAAIVVGASSQTAYVTADGVGFLIRGNGGYQLFDTTDGSYAMKASGDLGDDFGIDETGFYDVRINYFVPRFDDVTPGMVAVFVDDQLIHSFTTDSGFDRNYMNFIGYGPRSTYSHYYFDDLKIWSSYIPEPATLALLGGGLLVLWRRRRRA